MKLTGFTKIFPKAYPAGQDKKVTAYQVDYIHSYVTKAQIHNQNIIWGFGSPDPESVRQALWFFFYKKRLIKWGRPGDWPPAPRLILNEIIKKEN